MIPLRLEMTNFLSYRKTAVLDFDGIHLACISGPNGAGKSSILDAMTWALFGKSRSKSDDDLVHRLAVLEDGACEVKYTFNLGGNIYRIIRRKRPGKSQLVELQLATGEGQWKPLSESKVRETEAAIERLLRMNYDTFTNASFLLQGKADEFTTKTPNRRKEILADLLGVSQWEQYKETVALRRREVENRQLMLETQLQEIASELAEEEERRDALEMAQAELAGIHQQRMAQEQLLQQARQTAAVMAQQEKMRQNLADNLARARRTLDSLQQTLAQRQQERDSYAAILAAAATIQADFAAWQAADAALQAWQSKAETYNRLQQARRPYELTIAQERSRREQRLQELQAQAQRAATAQSEQQTVAAQQTAAQARLNDLEHQLSALSVQEAAWEAAKTTLQKLEGERKLLAQQAAQLHQQAQRIAQLQQEEAKVAANKQAAHSQLTAVDTQLSTLAQQRERYAVALADKNSVEAEQARLREEMARHKERIERLSVETGGACPLCGQSLSETHRATVLADLQTSGEEMGGRFRANKERIASLTAEVTQLTEVLKRADTLEREKQAQQQRLASAEARLAEIARAVQEWESDAAARLAELETALADERELTTQRAKVAELATAVKTKAGLEKSRQQQQKLFAQAEARLAEITRQVQEWQQYGAPELAIVQTELESNNYAQEARQQLMALEAEQTAVGYDATAHAQARAARESLAEAPQRYQQWQQAQAAVAPLEQTIAELTQRIAEQTNVVEELYIQHETAVAQLDQLRQHSANLKAIEDELFRLREVESSKQRTVGAAQQRLDVLASLRQRRESIQQTKTELARHIQRLKLLEKACGRDGVQALLIEQALPEIEEHANELLERLSGGEMRVNFSTQRKLRSRAETVETLDIHIQDGAGERPYENFSGGEQFRVNFAIRLALSQVLARRAGASLQTLVIDEGFGSQDPTGRQRLVEAINTIQGGFARILVITHIDELRDAFPSRIEVNKTLAGSTINVVV